MNGSRDRFTATVSAVVRLWKETNVTIENDFFTFRNATTLPGCTQVPHPPIWVAAVQSRQSFAWIGQQGYKLLITPGISGYEALGDLMAVYKECFAQSHPDKKCEVAISLPVYVRDSDENAVACGDFYLQRYLDVWADAAKLWNLTVSSDYPRYSGFGLGLKSDSPASMRKRRAALVGSPTRIIEDIHWLKESLHIDVILLQIDFGAMQGSDAASSLRVFLDRVRPFCEY